MIFVSLRAAECRIPEGFRVRVLTSLNFYSIPAQPRVLMRLFDRSNRLLLSKEQRHNLLAI